MLGIQYGDYHSFYDFGLTLCSAPEISEPEAVSKRIYVPGRSGKLDLTEVFGDVTYDDREMQADFLLLAPREQWAWMREGIVNAIHGKKLNITMDDDTEHYYTGRVTVGALKPHKPDSARLTISAVVEPYKHSRYGGGDVL